MPKPKQEGTGRPLAEDVQTLLKWLETEVKDRLVVMDEKLDRALLHGPERSCADLSGLSLEANYVKFRQEKMKTPEAYIKPRRPDSSSVESPTQSWASDDVSLNGNVKGSIVTVQTPEELMMMRQPSKNSVAQRSNNSASVDENGRRRSNSSFVEKMTVWLESRHRGATSNFIYNVMEDPESGNIGYWYERGTPVVIFIAVLLTWVQTLDNTPLDGIIGLIIEIVTDTLFTLEAIVRFTVCPSKTAFFRNTYNLIDLTAIVSLALRAVFMYQYMMGDTTALALLATQHGRERNSLTIAFLFGVVPMLRILKVLRRYQKFHLLMRAFRLAFEALPVMIFLYMVMLLALTVLLFALEPPANIPNLPMAMWLAFTSITTVGYGDLSPVTAGARFMTAFFVFLSMLYMSVPLGIIGNAFSEVWGDRDRLLLMQKTRQKLVQWGYHAQDIPKLFRLFDVDKDQELNYTEFSTMVDEMRLGLQQVRILQLFNLFDNDGSGAINDKEFLKGLFPETFHRMYGSDRLSDRASIRSSGQFADEGPPGR